MPRRGVQGRPAAALNGIGRRAQGQEQAGSVAMLGRHGAVERRHAGVVQGNCVRVRSTTQEQPRRLELA